MKMTAGRDEMSDENRRDQTGDAGFDFLTVQIARGHANGRDLFGGGDIENGIMIICIN